MWIKLIYDGPHERDIDPTGTLRRFLDVLADMGPEMDRDELSQLPPVVGGVARPFSREASERLSYTDPVIDLFIW